MSPMNTDLCGATCLAPSIPQLLYGGNTEVNLKVFSNDPRPFH